MDARHNELGRHIETEILGCIVDAILSAETELSQASDNQWQQILVDSCRQQKLCTSPESDSVATRC